MCSPDIPEPAEIEPIIKIDPNASKAARVKTGAGQSIDATSKTGSQELRGKPTTPRTQTTNSLFSWINKLAGGSQTAGLQIGAAPPPVR